MSVDYRHTKRTSFVGLLASLTSSAAIISCDKAPQPSSTQTPPSSLSSRESTVAAQAAWVLLVPGTGRDIPAAATLLAQTPVATLRHAVYTRDPQNRDGVMLGDVFLPLPEVSTALLKQYLAACAPLPQEQRVRALAGLDGLLAGLMRSGDSFPGRTAEWKWPSWGMVASMRVVVLEELAKDGPAAKEFYNPETLAKLKRMSREFGKIVAGDDVP